MKLTFRAQRPRPIVGWLLFDVRYNDRPGRFDYFPEDMLRYDLYFREPGKRRCLMPLFERRQLKMGLQALTLGRWHSFAATPENTQLITDDHPIINQAHAWGWYTLNDRGVKTTLKDRLLP